MDSFKRSLIYGFLSRVFFDVLDEKFLLDLKSNSELLELIGTKSKNYILGSDTSKLLDDLNVDFTTLFVVYTKPIESFALAPKLLAVTGAESPVVQFYMRYDYEINMNTTILLHPDHLSIELGFMQAASEHESSDAASEFLKEHLVRWAVPYLISIAKMAETPFYNELCEFAAEFLLFDLQNYQSQQC